MSCFSSSVSRGFSQVERPFSPVPLKRFCDFFHENPFFDSFWHNSSPASLWPLLDHPSPFFPPYVCFLFLELSKRVGDRALSTVPLPNSHPACVSSQDGAFLYRNSPFLPFHSPPSLPLVITMVRFSSSTSTYSRLCVLQTPFFWSVYLCPSYIISAGNAVSSGERFLKVRFDLFLCVFSSLLSRRSLFPNFFPSILYAVASCRRNTVLPIILNSDLLDSRTYNRSLTQFNSLVFPLTSSVKLCLFRHRRNRT